MELRRHWRLVAVVLACVWFGAVVVWVTRDFVDAVPVGTDYNVVPPSDVTVDVACRSPLRSPARVDELLPELAPQPPERSPLAYEREPCVARRDSARMGLVISAVAFVGVIAVVTVTRPRHHEHDPAPNARTADRV